MELANPFKPLWLLGPVLISGFYDASGWEWHVNPPVWDVSPSQVNSPPPQQCWYSFSQPEWSWDKVYCPSTQHSGQAGNRTRGFSLTSPTPYHWPTMLPKKWKLPFNSTWLALLSFPQKWVSHLTTNSHEFRLS